MAHHGQDGALRRGAKPDMKRRKKGRRYATAFLSYSVKTLRLYKTLFHHCSSNLFEAGNVSALNQKVLVAEVFLSSVSTVLVDVLHDVVELIIYSLVLEYSVSCVLSHFDA